MPRGRLPAGMVSVTLKSAPLMTVIVAGMFVGDKNLVVAVRLTFQRSGAKQNCNTNEGSEWCFLENDFHA